MIFSIETRPKIIGENPGIKFGEVGKLLGAKWKEMSVEAKAVMILSFILFLLIYFLCLITC